MREEVFYWAVCRGLFTKERKNASEEQEEHIHNLQ